MNSGIRIARGILLHRSVDRPEPSLPGIIGKPGTPRSAT